MTNCVGKQLVTFLLKGTISNLFKRIAQVIADQIFYLFLPNLMNFLAKDIP